MRWSWEFWQFYRFWSHNLIRWWRILAMIVSFDEPPLKNQATLLLLLGFLYIKILSRLGLFIWPLSCPDCNNYWVGRLCGWLRLCRRLFEDTGTTTIWFLKIIDSFIISKRGFFLYRFVFASWSYLLFLGFTFPCTISSWRVSIWVLGLIGFFSLEGWSYKNGELII